jgi:hypothetical protein
MNELFNWILVLSYFSVFVIGLVTCSRSTSAFWKQQNYIKAISTLSVAIFAVGGLCQAFTGV